jgi:5,10-methylenetetrahydrofolate reductase
MVKLTTLIAEREKGDGLYFAVEYFPPRTADGLTKLYERSARIATQGERPARGGSSRVAFLLAFSFFFPVLQLAWCLPTPAIPAAGPLYADVTWGAGGSTSDLTLEMCIKLKESYGFEPNMHLTCTNMEESKVKVALDGAKAALEVMSLRRGD